VIRYGLRSAFIDSHPTLSQELDHHRFHADQAVALQNQVSYLKDVQRRTAGNVNVRIVRAAPYRRGTENLVQQSDGFLSARQLAEEIAWVESEAEETKRKREEFQEMFENFDQRSEELLNTLAAVLKAMQEMQGSVARNLL
jgi:hypothetical protein